MWFRREVGIKIDATNTIILRSSDLRLGTSNATYKFIPANKGTRIFGKEYFTNKTAGLQSLIVSNVSYGLVAKQAGISVIPNIPIYFSAAVSSFTQFAGSTFSCSVSQMTDAYKNFCDGIVTVTNGFGMFRAPNGAEPVFNNINISLGVGANSLTLFKSTNTVIKTKIKNATFSNLISIVVRPSSVNDLVLKGFQTLCTSGIKMRNNVSITLAIYDKYGNIKTDYTNSVFFTSTDPTARFTYSNITPYKFLLSDAGVKVFAGTNFTLYKAGTHVISVTDSGGLTASSAFIDVVDSSISSFNIVLTTYTQMAGKPFTVTVTNALDTAGNLANGIIKLTNRGSDLSSFSGLPPSYGTIVVNQGVGRNNVIIYRSTNNVQLKAYSLNNINVTNILSTLLIKPASLDSIRLLSGISICTAGKKWSNITSLTIKTFDPFLNLKTDFTNKILLSSSDLSGVFPITNTFTSLDLGYKIIFGTNIILKKSGYQKMRVTDSFSGLFFESDNILVLPNVIYSFSVKSQSPIVVGQSFIIDITNALDTFGNKASGMIHVTNIASPLISPFNHLPDFNDINIINGFGSGNQTIYLSTNTTFKLTDLIGGATNSTMLIKFVPRPASGLIIISPLTNILNANGTNMTLVTSSTIRDNFGNIVTNGTIGTAFLSLGTITNTDLLPAPAFPGIQTMVENGILRFGVKAPTLSGLGLMNVQIDAASGSTNIRYQGITLLSVSSPQDIISTGQTGIPVYVLIQNNSSETLKNASVELSLSAPYFSGSGPIMTNIPPLSSSIILFSLSVTSNAPPGIYSFNASLSGTLDGSFMTFNRASVTDAFVVQNKGDLLIENLVVPQQAVVGYTFPVIVRVKNIGQATVTNVNPANFMISVTNAVVSFNVTNYTPKNFTLMSGQSVDFIYAFTVSGSNSQMSFSSGASGIDKNSGHIVLSSYSNSSLLKLVTLQNVELKLAAENISPMTVVKGEEKVAIWKLSFINPLGVGPNNTIQINEINLGFINYLGNPISPASAIKKISLFSLSSTNYIQTSFSVSSNNIRMHMTNTMQILPSQTNNFYIYVDIADQATADTMGFKINDQSSIHGYLINFTNAIIQKIVDTTGNLINDLRSDYLVIKDATINSVAGNYPNPFKAGEEETTIEYFIDKSAKVSMKIYTLTGSPVKTILNGIQKTSGIQQELWNGRTDEGHIVRNGVYLCVISVDNKKTVVKIVVVK